MQLIALEYFSAFFLTLTEDIWEIVVKANKQIQMEQCPTHPTLQC